MTSPHPAGSIAIVVSSCDRFFDCWRPFAHFFQKHWSRCPFPVCLIVNELTFRSSFIQPLAVGPDRGWASNMQRALGQIQQSHLLYFQEDYFLTGPVDETQLAADIAFALAHQAASLSFSDLALLEPDFAPATGRFGLVPVDSKGRTRLQVALWEKEKFQTLLHSGEDAWQMEARGSRRTREMTIYSYGPAVAGPIPYLRSAVVRGLWTAEAQTMCTQAGIALSPRFRSGMAATNRGCRWRRALGRVRYRVARARQGGRPVDLSPTAACKAA